MVTLMVVVESEEKPIEAVIKLYCSTYPKPVSALFYLILFDRVAIY